MKVFPTLCENYSAMSKGFYQQYKEATDYLNGLKCSTWDLLSHTEEENNRYKKASQLRFHSALAAVVFQALAVEAFANLYSVHEAGEELFYSERKKEVIKNKKTKSTEKQSINYRMTTVEKLKKICKDYLGCNYSTNNKGFNRLKSLLQKRNDIVHTKPKEIDMSKESNNYNDFSYQYEFVYKDIDEEMNVYETVKKTMQTLKGSQFDLIEEMQRFILGEWDKNIGEINKIAARIILS